MIFCLSCGGELDPEGRCPACEVPEPLPPPPRNTRRYEQFREAVEQVRQGRWGREEFAGFLAATSRQLAEKARETTAFLEETGYGATHLDEAATGLAGFADYEAGIQELRRYLDDSDPSHLERGLELVWEGNEKLNVALWMNREARR